MEERHRGILRRHKSILENDLEPNDILSKLTTVLYQNEEDEIKVQSTRMKRCDKLFDILPRKGPKAFEVFVEALKNQSPHLASCLIEAAKQETENELQTRVQSAKLREENAKLKAELEAEKQNHMKTLEQLKDLKTLHGKGNEMTKEIEITAGGLQKMETTTESLNIEKEDERKQNENVKEENECLLQMCNHLDETKKQSLNYLQGRQEAETSKDNQELAKRKLLKNESITGKLLNDIRKDLARVTDEWGEFKERFENLGKQLEEVQAVGNLEKQRTTAFQDRATSPRESKEFECKDECSSRCEDLRNERDSAREETSRKEIHEMKTISEDYQRKHQALQKNLVSVTEEFWSMDVENEQVHKESSARRSKRDDPGIQVRGLREIPGHKKGPKMVNAKIQEEIPRVTEERNKLKERYESLVKQQGEVQFVDRLGKEPTTTFQDKATSPRELKWKEEPCSRCKGLKNERDSERTENQTLRKEIYKLKTITESYQRQKQAPQKNLKSEKGGQGNLQLLSDNLEVAKKEQEEKMRQLQRKNEELEDKVTKKTSEFEKTLACERKKLQDCREKFQAETKTKDVFLWSMGVENERLHKESSAERSKCDELREEVRRLKLRLKERPGRIHNYRKDFDENGVVYALATNFGGTNASRIRVIATRSSNEKGEATDILEHQLQKEIVSGTKDEEQSWWCVDLTENYALYLTHYTLRHGHNTSWSLLRNWQLEGSLDGRNWTTVKKHKNDRGLKEHHPYCTCTWTIDGNSNAFRFFRILQTGKNSSGRFSIFLSGIELYGVLIEKCS